MTRNPPRSGYVMRHQARYNRRAVGHGAGGFTLFEALLAVTLVGIAVVALTSALMAGLAQNQSAVQYTIAMNLATALMNEICSHPFRDPTTPANFTPRAETGETPRAGFDNVDDYDGLVEADGQLKGPDGQVLSDPSLAGYTRTASASYVTFPGQDARYTPAFILVTVEVQYKDISMVKLNRVISSEERR
jgi:hypothetical protein